MTPLSRRQFLAAPACGLMPATARAAAPTPALLSPPYAWSLSPPLVSPAARPADPCHAVKDPTVVYHDRKWHLFATTRSKIRTHQIEYLSFADWRQADTARRHVLTVTDGYFCAPQVFFHTPHRKWYLVYQVADPARKPQLQPAFSTTTDIADPASWSEPTLLFEKNPAGVSRWIDFWVICDATHARLFFTSLDGRMWRADARRADFPHGWGAPRVVLTADIFEASHTYKVKGRDRYFTFVEARAGDRRYFKAYTAGRLDGGWEPLADTRDAPFAGVVNIGKEPWTASVSHGELVRSGADETMEVDPSDVRVVFQGVSDADRKGKTYGDIPWRLGRLDLRTPGPGR